MGLLDAYVSRRDLTQLIRKCIEAEHIQFAIFNGLSNNRFKRLDLSDARELVGYEPEDDLRTSTQSSREPAFAGRARTQPGGHDSQKSGIQKDLA